MPRSKLHVQGKSKAVKITVSVTLKEHEDIKKALEKEPSYRGRIVYFAQDAIRNELNRVRYGDKNVFIPSGKIPRGTHETPDAIQTEGDSPSERF